MTGHTKKIDMLVRSANFNELSCQICKQLLIFSIKVRIPQ